MALQDNNHIEITTVGVCDKLFVKNDCCTLNGVVLLWMNTIITYSARTIYSG